MFPKEEKMVKALGWIAPATAFVMALALFLTTPGPVSAVFDTQECTAQNGDCCLCSAFTTQPDTTYLCFPVYASQENPEDGWEGMEECSSLFCPEERNCIKGGGN
jgi:hypothetical protein